MPINQHFDHQKNHIYNHSIYRERMLADQFPSSQRNFRSLAQLIDRLFEHHSRLLVVRTDHRYSTETKDSIPLETIQMHLSQMLGDRRRFPEIYGHLVGYAWGLEVGHGSGGFHFHLLTLFNGAHKRNDVMLGMSLATLWKEITNGAGETYISNYDKSTMDAQGLLGIGMIHRDDVAKRINLIERVAGYITKKCSDFDIAMNGSTHSPFRTFGRSKMPPPLDLTMPRRGRPVQRYSAFLDEDI